MTRLTCAPAGEASRIRAIWLTEETKGLLEDFGLAVGGEIRVISKIYGDALIVCIGGRRIAIGEELACKIIVSPCDSSL